MKKILFSLFMLSFLGFSQSKNIIKAEYVMSIKLSEEQLKEIPLFLRKKVQEKLDKEKNKFHLLINNYKALFTPVNISANYKIGTQYTDQEKDETIKQEYILDKKFIIKEKLNKKEFSWKLEKETKKINNFLCKKATLEEENIIFWYTTDIPTFFGPLGYYGLPGLVIVLEKKEMTLNLTTVSFPDELLFFPPKDGKIILREKFEKIKKEKSSKIEKTSGINIKIN